MSTINSDGGFDDSAELLEQFRRIVGKEHVQVGAALLSLATSYWNPEPLNALCRVKPASTEEVSRLLATCSKLQQSVVIQGGATGVVAGADPAPSDVVISLERLNQIVHIDNKEMVAEVEAGVVLQTLQETLAAEDLLFPLDLGARGSCMIGGNVATNAGGINVLRYGMVRNLVLGLEVVQMDGTVLSNLYPMLKNNTGYDLKQLFIGSEGTLGVITKVLLRLYPLPSSCQTALLAVNQFDDVVVVLNRLRARLSGTLSAFEVMWHNYFAGVTGEGKHRSPLAGQYPYYIVVEAEGFDDESDQHRFAALLGAALEDGLIADAVIATSSRERSEIWQIREDFAPLLPAYLYDVSLPIQHMQSYAAALTRMLEQQHPESTAWLFGHIADGNLHIFIGPYVDEAFYDVMDKLVYETLAEFDGSVSAEHGIGVKKKPWLHLNRSPEELQLMRAIKQVLDPNGLLNPGKVL
jgi:FAD/FMN-containing dehydrogenase